MLTLHTLTSDVNNAPVSDVITDETVFYSCMREVFTDENAIDGQYGMLIDSGASCHVTPHRFMLFNYRPTSSRLSTAIGSNIPISGQGDTNSFKNVYHAPSMTNGIISVSCLDAEGFSSSFADGVCTVTRPDQTILFTAKQLSSTDV
jgi:hypothetical protein